MMIILSDLPKHGSISRSIKTCREAGYNSEDKILTRSPSETIKRENVRISKMIKVQRGPPSTDAMKMVFRVSLFVASEKSKKYHSRTNIKNVIRYNAVIADITTRRCAFAPCLEPF